MGDWAFKTQICANRLIWAILEGNVIHSVYVWDNAMVMVFDQNGQQLADYQGKATDVLPKVLAEAPVGAVFYRGVWHNKKVMEVERRLLNALVEH